MKNQWFLEKKPPPNGGFLYLIIFLIAIGIFSIIFKIIN